MLDIFMIGVTLLLVVVFIIVTVKKHKEMKSKAGPKSLVTPICFLCAPVLALVAYLFDFAGFISWMILGVLFIVAAFHTKYLPERVDE